MLDNETKAWLQNKIQMEPHWILDVYIPALEKNIERHHSQLHQANRSGTFDEIRLKQGCLDGAAEALALICGLRVSETNTPVAPGLLARILSFGGVNGKV